MTDIFGIESRELAAGEEVSSFCGGAGDDLDGRGSSPVDTGACWSDRGTGQA